jgi:hypothetical protein
MPACSNAFISEADDETRKWSVTAITSIPSRTAVATIAVLYSLSVANVFWRVEPHIQTGSPVGRSERI